MKQLRFEFKCKQCSNIQEEDIDLHVDELLLDDEELLYHLLGRFSKDELYNFLLIHDLVPNEHLKLDPNIINYIIK